MMLSIWNRVKSFYSLYKTAASVPTIIGLVLIIFSFLSSLAPATLAILVIAIVLVTTAVIYFLIKKLSNSSGNTAIQTPVQPAVQLPVQSAVQPRERIGIRTSGNSVVKIKGTEIRDQTISVDIQGRHFESENLKIK